MTPLTARTGADRCPGVLRPFPAEDGLIVRVRVPGGEIAIVALRELMRLAATYGVPQIQLTTRANLQLRGLPDPLPDGFVEALEAAGLLPSRTHERARNILAAPTSPAQRARARKLDARLCSRPALAQLSGRFLMLVTDGSGLGLSAPYDVAHLDTGDGDGLLLAGGLGRACPAGSAYDAMLDFAEQFLAARTDDREWNVRDLPAGSPLLAGFSRTTVPTADPLVPGPVGPDLVAGVPDGLLLPRHLETLASVTASLVLTPWRSVVIEGGVGERTVLGRAGFDAG